MDPNNWIQLNRNLDTQNKHTLFEGKIKDIFNNTMPPGSHYNWKDMNEKLKHSKPSGFNKKAKKILT